jgi:hypothetical protein
MGFDCVSTSSIEIILARSDKMLMARVNIIRAILNVCLSLRTMQMKNESSGRGAGFEIGSKSQKSPNHQSVPTKTREKRGKLDEVRRRQLEHPQCDDERMNMLASR